VSVLRKCVRQVSAWIFGIYCHEREGSVRYKHSGSQIGHWIYCTLAACNTCDYNLLYIALANSPATVYIALSLSHSYSLQSTVTHALSPLGLLSHTSALANSPATVYIALSLSISHSLQSTLTHALSPLGLLSHTSAPVPASTAATFTPFFANLSLWTFSPGKLSIPK
jgi:hypothetical protein